MKMQDLSEAMATGVVPVVKGYGLTLKDTGAALATYGDLNIRGAKAGTELRMAVQALAVPAAAGKTELASLGLTTKSLSQDMQSGGLLKALDDLNTRFKANGITAKNEGAVITELFGKKAGAGLALLLENMDRVQSKYPALTKGANNFNKAWEATQATPQQKWKELTAGFQAAAVNFGTEMLPAFTKAAGFADHILTDLNGSKGAWKDVAIGAGGLAALFTGKKLVSGIESAFQTGETALRGIGKLFNIPSLSGLGKNAGQIAGADAAASGLSAVGGAADGAAGALGRLATTAGEGGLPGVLPGGKPGGKPAAAGEEAAVAAEDAAAVGIGSKIAAGLGKSIGPMIAVAIADSVLHSIPSGPGGKNWFDNPFGMPGPTQHASSHNYLTSFSPYERDISRGFSQISQMFTDPWDAIFGTGKPAAPKPKDWTSVLGDSATYGRLPPPPPSSAPQSPAAIQQSGLGAASAMRFGGGTTDATPARTAAVPAAQSMDLLGGAGHPGTVKIPAPLTSGLDAAKAKVQSDINAINSVMSGMKAKGVKIPAPDLSAMDTAKAKLQADLSGINSELSKVTGKPSKVGAPDLSALDAAKGKAVADAGQIMSGLQSALQKTVKASAPDISAYRGAIGPAEADGQAVSAGFAAGIMAGEGAAVAAAAGCRSCCRRRDGGGPEQAFPVQGDGGDRQGHLRRVRQGHH